MSINTTKTTLALALLISSTASQALVFSYNEATDGDLSSQPEFSFNQAGTYTFSGQTFATKKDGAFSQDGDLFDFTFTTPGLVLKVIETSAEVAEMEGVDAAASVWTITDPLQPTVYFKEGTDIVNSPSVSAGSVDLSPFSPNTYRSGVGAIIDTPDSDNYFLSWNWSVTYELADTAAVSVPEPASLTLFALGLAGLGLARRKR